MKIHVVFKKKCAKEFINGINNDKKDDSMFIKYTPNESERWHKSEI